MSKIIDTSEPAKQSRLHPKRLIVIGIGVVVLVAVGGLIFMTQQKTAQKSTLEDSPIDPISAAHDEASELASKDKGKALEYYDGKVSDAKSAAEKSELLLGKASVAYNVGDYDAALQAALDADAAKSSAGTLNVIAQAYEAKGDKVKALEYYKKALAVLPTSEITDRQKVTLETKIAELSR